MGEGLSLKSGVKNQPGKKKESDVCFVLKAKGSLKHVSCSSHSQIGGLNDPIYVLTMWLNRSEGPNLTFRCLIDAERLQKNKRF